MVKPLSYMANWIKRYVGFKHTSSRWGAVAMILSISIPLFLLGVSMLPLASSWQAILIIVFLVIGGSGIAFAIGLVVYWLVKGSEDPTTEAIDTIKDDMNGIKMALDKLTTQVRRMADTLDQLVSELYNKKENKE